MPLLAAPPTCRARILASRKVCNRASISRNGLPRAAVGQKPLSGLPCFLLTPRKFRNRASVSRNGVPRAAVAQKPCPMAFQAPPCFLLAPRKVCNRASAFRNGLSRTAVGQKPCPMAFQAPPCFFLAPAKFATTLPLPGMASHAPPRGRSLAPWRSGLGLFSLDAPQSLQPRFRFPEWPPTRRRGQKPCPMAFQAPPCFLLMPRKFRNCAPISRNGPHAPPWAEALPNGVQAPLCFPPDYFRGKPPPAGRARAAA